MKLEQLELLKKITDDTEVLMDIIDNDDIIIDEMIKTLHEVKRKGIDSVVEYKYLSSYMKDYFEYTKFRLENDTYSIKVKNEEENNNTILKNGEKFRRLLFSIQKTNKIKELLKYWQKNDVYSYLENYDVDLYHLLVNKNIQNLDTDNLTKLYRCYNEHKYEYKYSDFNLTNFILNLINYRSVDEIIITIENNHNFNVKNYNTSLMEKRSFNEVNELISCYDEVKPTLLNQGGDLDLENRIIYIKKIMNSDVILSNRNIIEQKELMNIFSNYPSKDLYDLIYDENLLTKRTHEEHMTLLKIFISNSNKYVKNLILNNNLLDMPIINQISILTLFLEDESVDLYNEIMNNINSSYVELEKKIKNYSSINTNVSNVINNYSSINSLYNVLKNNGIKDFDSKTRTKMLKINEDK